MKTVSPLAVPAARKALLANNAFHLALMVPSALMAGAGMRLWPGGFPSAIVSMLVVVVLFVVRRSGDAYDSVEKPDVSARLSDGSEFPAYWEAVRTIAPKMGIPVPRLYVLNGFRLNYAMSWGTGLRASVGVNRVILTKFTPDMIEAAVSHELAHLRMRDSGFVQWTKGTVHFLRSMAVLLFSVALVVLVSSGELQRQILALVSCFLATLSFLWQYALCRWALPWLQHWQEYAADELGIAAIGNPEGMLKVMLHATLEMRDTSVTVRPVAGDDGPTPMTRIRQILRGHLGALRRRS